VEQRRHRPLRLCELQLRQKRPTVR
jgi:hypothetical protein